MLWSSEWQLRILAPEKTYSETSQRGERFLLRRANDFPTDIFGSQRLSRLGWAPPARFLVRWVLAVSWVVNVPFALG